MNTIDLLLKWSTLTLDEIRRELEPENLDPSVAQLFGPEEVQSMQAWIADPPLSRGSLDGVVLLPGGMGSELTSIRGVTSLLWFNPLVMLHGQSTYLELNADGNGDESPRVEVVPSGLIKFAYLKMSLALHQSADLYEFPFDWRRPIESNAEILQRCIERWADGDAARKFTLVGHSMGGLVARTYMARYPDVAERRVKQVILLGTPNFGTVEMITDLLADNWMMQVAANLNANNVPRRFLVNLPGIYQILPPPRALFPAHVQYPVDDDWDLYRATAWHRDDIRQDYLDGARRFHQLLADSDPQIPIASICGCHMRTAVAIKRTATTDDRFDFVPEEVEEGDRSGDGTVPLWSSRLPGAECYYVQHTHMLLPMNSAAIQTTLALITGDQPTLQGVLPPRQWFTLPFRDTLTDPDVEATRIRRQIEEGTATQADLLSLYFTA